jgi:hypothetical protein
MGVIRDRAIDFGAFQELASLALIWRCAAGWAVRVCVCRRAAACADQQSVPWRLLTGKRRPRLGSILKTLDDL